MPVIEKKDHVKWVKCKSAHEEGAFPGHLSVESSCSSSESRLKPLSRSVTAKTGNWAERLSRVFVICACYPHAVSCRGAGMNVKGRK